MRGTVLYGPRDVRFEEVPAPVIVQPTDAVIKVAAACVCGSDLWPYRGISAIDKPTRSPDLTFTVFGASTVKGLTAAPLTTRR